MHFGISGLLSCTLNQVFTFNPTMQKQSLNVCYKKKLVHYIKTEIGKILQLHSLLENSSGLQH